METLKRTTSRITSPVEKDSPSLNFQLPTPPSVIVGDMAGIRSEVVA